MDTPKKQQFAFNNIQMNMSKSEVEKVLKQPKRVTFNEYGTKWYTYYDGDYNNFIMVSYIKDKVNAIYSNQNIITSKSKIKYNTPKSVVRQRLGEPETEIVKGRVRYEQNNKEYDVFHKNHIYTTVFYDKHRRNNVTAVLQVSDAMENRLKEQYGAPSKSLANSYELQNFDLVNAERKQHELPTLKYSKQNSETARKHSKDMADNHYFDHTNLKGQSPFDRLKKDGITFRSAGENLAYGQVSSIYAHEGLMNSLGHRKNILNDAFNTLGVGVDFNDEKQPFWTENYTG
ncbi:TPA: CAP domain-containing protein [Staphylococcus argenteus]|nr:secretion protein [Staphylococcus argenteus]ATY58189.1 secretion protein [Staphylococcus argenteus]ATZ88418.1 CAP domain-containing protein [Staphylococcus argenteus]KAA0802602.1 CAP domain-containing protein [Staphylococcus argenteus]MZG24819.1 CAP domain-containing protein [Staphylococcus argenteus]